MSTDQLLAQIAQRNDIFVRTSFSSGLTINPARQLMVIGCVDPRVDPSVVLGLQMGDAGIIRNVGGRVTPATIRTMGMLAKVGAANRGAPSAGWTLVVLHHTDCGMTDLAPYTDLLAEYFEIPADGVEAKSASDPYTSTKVDVQLLRQTAPLNAVFAVTGLVYDVRTGSVEVVVAPLPPATV